MPDQRFSDWVLSTLGASGALLEADAIPIVRGSADTRRATLADLSDLFAAELSPFPGYRTGGTRFYNNAPRFAAGVTNISQAIDTIHYSPMYIRRRVVCDRFYVQTGTTSLVGLANVGIYSSVGGQPDAKLFDVAAGVNIPAVNNQAQVFTPTAGTITLDPGFYWFAVQSSAALVMSGAATLAWFGFDFGTTNNAALMANTSQATGYTQAAAYGGGLPANASGLTISTTAVTSGGFRVQ